MARPVLAEVAEVGLGTGVMPIAVIGGLQAGDLPLSLHANGWYGVLTSVGGAWSVYGKTTRLVPTGRPEFGLVGGLGYAYEDPGPCIGFYPPDQNGYSEPANDCDHWGERPIKGVAGVVYQQAWHELWWRITPTALLSSNGVQIPTYGVIRDGVQGVDYLSIPPLIEVGYRSGSMSTSLRLSLMFLSETYVF